MVVVDAIKEFAGYTTIHGCGRCADSKYLLQRIFWCVLTLGCMAMTCYQISRLHRQFTAGHLATSLELSPGNVTFPVFRFCSLNPCPYSAVKKNKELMAILYATQQKFGVNLSDFDKAGETTIISDAVKTASSSYKISDLAEARKLFVQKLQVIKEDYGDDDKDPFSFSIDDILLKCTFQGTDCVDSPLHFAIQQDELYGTCYEVKAPNVPVHTAGPEQGLELLIYLNHEEFIPFIAESIGINTRIYGSGNKNSFLAESSDGVKLSAGFDIRIAMSLVGTFESST
ncbi:amiloride-sensitive sodium channel subunit gamma-2-like [Pecten maximus]|uniref:amiloride-sensitive sodium channel subunit gamma-2-like n=1 Tax=Pecten maximus TaxID=6579 RepID=UPI00145901FA|nr:amiloride-sensitive sodium channel subunit gamma-2-like [Pecten maximus]